MRRFLQSNSKNLPLLLGQIDHHQAAILRELKVVYCNSINRPSQRSINHQSNSVLFQASKTSNGSSRGSKESGPLNNNREHDNGNDTNNNNNDKPKRGGSSRMSPPRRQAGQEGEPEQETIGQKLAKTFGFQTKTKKTTLTKTAGTAQKEPAKRSTRDQVDNNSSPPKRSGQATSSSSSRSSRSQFASSTNNDGNINDNNRNSWRQNQQDKHQQTNRRQASSSSMSSSSSRRPPARDNDNKVGRDHRASGSVKHDKQGRRFILDLGNNQVARIDYRPAEQTTTKYGLSSGGGGGASGTDRRQAQQGQQVIELYHTEVPAELRGQGIGKQLARGAFECASEAGMRLKVTCDYLLDYVHRFAGPDQKRLLVGEKRK